MSEASHQNVRRFSHPGRGRNTARPIPKGRQVDPKAKVEIEALLGDRPRQRDLLIERTQSGLARARAEGKPIGRPHSLPAAVRAAVKEGLAAGETVAALARRHRTSRQTIMRIRDAALRTEMGADQ